MKIELNDEFTRAFESRISKIFHNWKNLTWDLIEVADNYLENINNDSSACPLNTNTSMTTKILLKLFYMFVFTFYIRVYRKKILLKKITLPRKRLYSWILHLNQKIQFSLDYFLTNYKLFIITDNEISHRTRSYTISARKNLLLSVVKMRLF